MADDILTIEELEEMAAFAAAMVRSRGATRSESWVLVPRDFHGIGTERCSIVLNAGRLAPTDELLRIDYSLFDVESGRRGLARLLIDDFCPLLERALDIRIVTDQRLDCLVISRKKPWDYFFATP